MQKQEYAKLGAYGQTTMLGPPEPVFRRQDYISDARSGSGAGVWSERRDRSCWLRQVILQTAGGKLFAYAKKWHGDRNVRVRRETERKIYRVLVGFQIQAIARGRDRCAARERQEDGQIIQAYAIDDVEREILVGERKKKFVIPDGLRTLREDRAQGGIRGNRNIQFWVVDINDARGGAG